MVSAKDVVEAACFRSSAICASGVCQHASARGSKNVRRSRRDVPSMHRLAQRAFGYVLLETVL
jgi:hypothetical protein